MLATPMDMVGAAPNPVKISCCCLFLLLLSMWFSECGIAGWVPVPWPLMPPTSLHCINSQEQVRSAQLLWVQKLAMKSDMID